MARPFKEINWDMVELYIKAGCQQNKIAECFFITSETLRERVKEKYGLDYSVFSSSLRSEGDMLIEAKQMEKAMKGYWPALQWLGKIRLGQKEPEVAAYLAPNQSVIDQTHRIMELENEIALLKALHADKSEAE